MFARWRMDTFAFRTGGQLAQAGISRVGKNARGFCLSSWRHFGKRERSSLIKEIGRGIMGPHIVPDFKRQRQRMVNEQLLSRGISDPAVLDAMARTQRHLFVPEALQPRAYDDHPLPIGYGQTISQPYIVACMTQLLEATPGMSILEVGTGSGYQSAVLAAMGLNVFTVERVRELYFPAKELFRNLGLLGIRTRIADGTLGWEENAPFDRIIVTAGGPDIPSPLLEQLADPGIMVIPVGKNRREQRLVRVFKTDGAMTAKALGNVTFVDLVGDHGW